MWEWPGEVARMSESNSTQSVWNASLGSFRPRIRMQLCFGVPLNDCFVKFAIRNLNRTQQAFGGVIGDSQDLPKRILKHN